MANKTELANRKFECKGAICLVKSNGQDGRIPDFALSQTGFLGENEKCGLSCGVSRFQLSG
jgi:hypothetical protein